MRKFLKIFIILGGAFLLLGMCADFLKKGPMTPIDRLRVRFYAGDKLPEPANIVSTGAWYLLHHVSSGLVAYDSKIGQFAPFFAKSWKIEGNGDYTFEISGDARFSDGTRILAGDIEATLKRILIKKTSTHFHLWEYLKGCDQLKGMEDTCPGLEAVSDDVIRFHLTLRLASFFLQLSTPETGILAKDDIDPETLEIKPTKFSGPYSIDKMGPVITLKRNDFNPLIKGFPNAPKIIESVNGSYAEVEEKLARGEVDVLIRNEKPMSEPDWREKGLESTKSSPQSIIYLHSLDSTGQKRLLGK